MTRRDRDHADLFLRHQICFKGAHFIKQDVKAFDSSVRRVACSLAWTKTNAPCHQFFSITAEEAEAIDPQQRMLLEVSVEALDNGKLDTSYRSVACREQNS